MPCTPRLACTLGGPAQREASQASALGGGPGRTDTRERTNCTEAPAPPAPDLRRAQGGEQAGGHWAETSCRLSGAPGPPDHRPQAQREPHGGCCCDFTPVFRGRQGQGGDKASQLASWGRSPGDRRPHWQRRPCNLGSRSAVHRHPTSHPAPPPSPPLAPTPGPLWVSTREGMGLRGSLSKLQTLLPTLDPDRGCWAPGPDEAQGKRQDAPGGSGLSAHFLPPPTYPP